MEIPFKVVRVLSDKAEEQIVVLKGLKNGETFTFWVGPTEGDAIRFVLDHVHPTRPMTHDLLRNLLQHFSFKVDRIVIHDIQNATYFSKIYLNDKNGADLTVDARPSDAIALALRVRAPIFVTEEVLQKKSEDNMESLLEKFKTDEGGE